VNHIEIRQNHSHVGVKSLVKIVPRLGVPLKLSSIGLEENTMIEL
jgi:hypothetical protein